MEVTGLFSIGLILGIMCIPVVLLALMVGVIIVTANAENEGSL
jgi:hypothetical protein